MNACSDLEMLEERGKGRRTEFLQKVVKTITSKEEYLDVVSDKSHRKIILRYLRTPTELVANEDGWLSGVKLQRNFFEQD